MSLKKSIVIVNEYTIKNGKKSGSRGGSPGNYVMEYMSRNKAVEDVTPVRLYDTESYITRYMARKEAAESMDSVPGIKHKMRSAQKKGGLAFGYGDVSLSDARLRSASRDIQYQFDKGKTVLKTVISFEEDYLREHGIIDENFVFTKKGDYRGNIDQMKLRMAIMNGLEKLSGRYDDLQYVGVIQVDTAHVHCHLAMVDRGRGNLMKDGTQRGRLLEKDKRLLRRGIDLFLDEKQSVKMMASSIDHDKRNALCYIKKFTHKAMFQQGLPQFLLACLPENQNYWRADTNRKDMRQANAIVREFVIQTLAEPGSGYREAMHGAEAYADYRVCREGLSQSDREKLIRNKQEQLVSECMNGVYSVLKQVPKKDRVIRTPMLDTMAMDYQQMAAQNVNDPMLEFGFKLRSYSSRLKHHRKECHAYREEKKNYDKQTDNVAASRVMRDFFEEEEEYHAMLMTKYQYFLTFLPPEENLEDEFLELMEYQKRLENLKKMRDDPSFKRIKRENAEEYGQSVYGENGGWRLAVMPQIFGIRVSRFGLLVKQKTEDFRHKLQDYGMDFDGKQVTRQKRYQFDDVKALDLHHLGYDFPYDAGISKINVDRFCARAEKRYQVFEKAREYLLGSGQEEAVKALPERDILFMKEYADRLQKMPSVISNRAAAGGRKPVRTVKLDTHYAEDMKYVVESTVRALQLGE